MKIILKSGTSPNTDFVCFESEPTVAGINGQVPRDSLAFVVEWESTVQTGEIEVVFWEFWDENCVPHHVCCVRYKLLASLKVAGKEKKY